MQPPTKHLELLTPPHGDITHTASRCASPLSGNECTPTAVREDACGGDTLRDTHQTLHHQGKGGAAIGPGSSPLELFSNCSQVFCVPAPKRGGGEGRLPRLATALEVNGLHAHLGTDGVSE